VLPLVKDTQASIQAKVVHFTHELLLLPLLHSLKQLKVPRKKDAEPLRLLLSGHAFSLLRLCERERHSYIAKCLQLMRVAASQTARAKYAQTLGELMSNCNRVCRFVSEPECDALSAQTHAHTHTASFWFMFSELAGHQPRKVKTVSVQECWAAARKGSASVQKHILSTLTHIAGAQVDQRAFVDAQLLPVLLTSLLSDDVSPASSSEPTGSSGFAPALVVAQTQALQLLCAHKQAEWLREIAANVEACLNGYCSGARRVSAPLLCKKLFVCGEVIAAVQARRTNSTEQKGNGGKHASLLTQLPSHLVTLIQALTAQHLPTLPSSSEHQGGAAVPPTVRAHAFVALGKLCLCEREFAKKVIFSMVSLAV
jgi:hypothetical protein